MSEVPKRWHVPRYLSFPLIVASLLLLAAKLVALERADLIARLSDQVAHGDEQSATAAVRHLAAMPHPPFKLLVEAATSANAQVAGEAQAAIGNCLRRLQRNIAARRHLDATAKQLSELVELLVLHHDAFANGDQVWLGRTTRKIIRMANRLPAQSTPLLASHCDTILASLRSYEITSTTFVAAEAQVAAMPALTEVSIPAGEATSTAANDLRHSADERFATLVDRPNPATPSITPARTNAPALTAAPTTPVADLSAAGTRATQSLDDDDSKWRPEWSHPMFFTVPAMPIEAMPLPADSVPPVVNPLRAGSIAPSTDKSGDSVEDETPTIESLTGSSLIGVETRDLLTRWVMADGKEAVSLEEELTARGFGRLSQRCIERYFSDDADDRLGLIDDVLTDSGAAARPWLLLLADDASADVRFVVVTIMATSNDPELIEKAWQVAIHDRDPRIASLAPRLRERRAAIESY